tara:strand:+ start:547 stop:783 length:237 start_codon:yes stop_codon:yes gene_type:complete
MKILLTLLAMAILFFSGACDGCTTHWKSNLDTADIVSETKNVAEDILEKTEEVKEDTIGLNIYMLYPHFRFIVRRSIV